MTVAGVDAVDQPGERAEGILAGAVLRIEVQRVGHALAQHVLGDHPRLAHRAGRQLHLAGALHQPHQREGLRQVDLALINTNYALEAGLDPARDALAIEGSDSPYVNILVSRADRKDDAAVQKLAKALHSDAVKAFIAEKYQGAVLPAF